MRRTTKRAVISLELQRLDAPRLVSFTRTIGKGITNNPNITAADAAKLPVSVQDLLDAATALETIHTTRGPSPSKASTKNERDQANSLMEALTNVAGFIEGLANTKAGGDFNKASAIIVSVGFQLKKISVRRDKAFEVESPEKGTAALYVPATEGAVRLAQYSGDGGKTWSTSIVVHGTVVILHGLKSGVEYAFRMAISTPPPKRAKLKIAAGSEEPAWSDPIYCVIS